MTSRHIFTVAQFSFCAAWPIPHCESSTSSAFMLLADLF